MNKGEKIKTDERREWKKGFESSLILVGEC